MLCFLTIKKRSAFVSLEILAKLNDQLLSGKSRMKYSMQLILLKEHLMQLIVKNCCQRICLKRIFLNLHNLA